MNRWYNYGKNFSKGNLHEIQYEFISSQRYSNKRITIYGEIAVHANIIRQDKISLNRTKNKKHGYKVVVELDNIYLSEYYPDTNFTQLNKQLKNCKIIGKIKDEVKTIDVELKKCRF